MESHESAQQYEQQEEHHEHVHDHADDAECDGWHEDFMGKLGNKLLGKNKQQEILRKYIGYESKK